jgi:chromosome segregation ATPase
MKKYLKHIIVVILFCLLSIIIFKYFVMKEGNELKDKIAELRTDASELEKKSYEYQNLSNSATSQANAFLNQAAEYESSVEAQTQFEYHVQEQALREQQSRAQAAELRNQEIINNEIENKKRIDDAELQYRYIKNKLLDYESKSQEYDSNLKQLLEHLNYMNNEYNQKKQLAIDMRKQANQAQQRRQDNWEQIYNNFNNMANNAEMESKLVLDQYKLAEGQVFNIQNEIKYTDEIISQLELDLKKDEIRNPDIINQNIIEIENKSRSSLDAQTIKTKLMDAKMTVKSNQDELYKLTEETTYLRNTLSETQNLLNIMSEESKKVYDNQPDNWEITYQGLVENIMNSKNKIFDLNEKLKINRSEVSKIENDINNGDKIVIELQLQLNMLG